jgi:hypothetical protein
LPKRDDGEGRLGPAWKLAGAFVAGAVVAGVAVALIVAPNHAAKPKTGPRPDIEMATATGLACGSPVAPGNGHPDPLLSQLFDVHALGGSYTLGWQIIPYAGSGRSYTFGKKGNLLALEPATGGLPVGFGQGTVTFRANPDDGTINAVITLKAGGSLTVGGPWTCVVASPTTVPTTTVPKPAGIS